MYLDFQTVLLPVLKESLQPPTYRLAPGHIALRHYVLCNNCRHFRLSLSVAALSSGNGLPCSTIESRRLPTL